MIGYTSKYNYRQCRNKEKYILKNDLFRSEMNTWTRITIICFMIKVK